jgi:hypothetical protein
VQAGQREFADEVRARVAGQPFGGRVHRLNHAFGSVSMMLNGAFSKTELLKFDRFR